MESRLSPELALRIGLAGRCLKTVGLRGLIDALIATLGLPLSAAALASLDVAALRRAGLNNEKRADLRLALAYLRGDAAIEIVDSPPAVPAAELDHSLRLAVATDNGASIDGNFGNCRSFLIYQVSAADIRLVEQRSPAPLSRRAGRDSQRTRLIGDCRLLYAQTLSNQAAARLTVNGIHPVIFPDGNTAAEKLADLQRVLASDHPPPWLAKAVGQHCSPRLAIDRPVLIHSR